MADVGLRRGKRRTYLCRQSDPAAEETPARHTAPHIGRLGTFSFRNPRKEERTASTGATLASNAMPPTDIGEFGVEVYATAMSMMTMTMRMMTTNWQSGQRLSQLSHQAMNNKAPPSIFNNSFFIDGVINATASVMRTHGEKTIFLCDLRRRTADCSE